MRLRSWSVAVLVTFSVGCPPPPAEVDAGSDVDAGLDDAGLTLDAGADAGMVDDAGIDAGADAGSTDAGVDAGVADAGKAAGCASTFGSALTNAFGRVDGVVTAVVPAGLMTCALPNSDHVVLQVAFADAGVHRMVVNVQSSFGDPRIKVLRLTAPLPPPAFQEGWHPGLRLDYPTAFGVHSEDAGWESLDLPTASQRVEDLVEVGANVSVYATSSGGTFAASAHLIHRNGNGADGALVFQPTGSSPQWLLFSFANQRF